MTSANAGTAPQVLTPAIEAGLSLKAKLFAVVFFFGWIVFFTVGLSVDSAPYREQLLDPFKLSFAEFLKAGFITIFCFTLTNLAILGSFAALLGPLGRRAKLGASNCVEPEMDVCNPYVSALIRGFFVYLVLLSGTVIFGSDVIVNPSSLGYVRTAGIFSLFAFLVNYNPYLFTGVVARSARLIAYGAKDDKAESKEDKKTDKK